VRSQKLQWVEKLFQTFFMTCLLVSALASRPAQAQNYKFKVLHTFQGKDGALPYNHLTLDAAGNIYGTTSVGGMGKGVCNAFGGCGTAFKLDKNGGQVWLHSFTGKNGMQPLAGLTPGDAGTLYGTTYLGGDTGCYQYGCGTVFKLDRTGKEKMLYEFTGAADGRFPEPLLTRDAEGNLYGTTYVGTGNIFKIDSAGKLTVLYQFTGGSDGCFPAPGVILDAAGNLYGVAIQGGSAFCNSGYGTAFMLDKKGNLRVLHTFGGSDGAYPNSLPLLDPAGNLYGTTNAGGNSGCGNGCGTVYELSPQSDGTWTENVLYDFCSLEGCADGWEPDGPLVRDRSGDIFGTTDSGGNSNECGGDGCGVVFKLEAGGKEQVLHTFTGGKDGARPPCGVTIDTAGNLYGVTQDGGNPSCPLNEEQGCGVVFKITP